MPSQTFQPVGVHGGRIVEDFAHDAIHAEKVWRTEDYVVLGAGSALSMLITTPASTNIHLVAAITTNGPGLGYIYEGPTASAGTSLTAINACRSHTNTTECTIVRNPTVATIGTVLHNFILGAEGFKSLQGGDSTDQLWNLAVSTKYLLRFTSDAATCRTILKMYWEEGD